MRILLTTIAISFLLLTISCQRCDDVMEEEATVSDSLLYDTWRFDSTMFITGNTALIVDSNIHQSAYQELVTTFHDDHHITFNYITTTVEGEGSFKLDKPGFFNKMQVYRTSIEADGYKFVSSYLDAMNGAESYSIRDTVLTIFYMDLMAKFTRK